MSVEKLEKLTIKCEKGRKGAFTEALKVGFNPAQLSYTSSATWQRVESSLGSKSTSSGTTVFRDVAPDTLTLTLFFDTYAPYAADAAGGLLASVASAAAGLAGGARVPPESVVRQTSAVMQLARVDSELHRPPVCQLLWGNNPPIFCGILERSTCTYTLFMPDGTPVRATMECTFMEIVGASDAVELHSADVVKTYVVRPGDTLMGIAAGCFGDGGLWRLIADENAIEDPRALVPGRTLAIPKVR